MKAKRICFCVTEEEYNHIKSQAIKQKTSITGFVLKRSMASPFWFYVRDDDADMPFYFYEQAK